MPKEITYRWGDDYLLIELGNRTEPRIKVLYIAEFAVTISMSVIFFIQALPLATNFAHWIAGTGSLALFVLASYRFISRMFYKEELLLDKYDFSIIRKTPFSKNVRNYDWNYMGPLHYAGKAQKTDHPLKGRTFDYWGFETHEHLIQSLYHDGNLCFVFDSYSISFARGVYSWDAEEMVRMMQLFIGPVLRLGPEWEQMLQEQEMDDN